MLDSCHSVLTALSKSADGDVGHSVQMYGCFFVINAMPIDFMRDKLNMTFDL